MPQLIPEADKPPAREELKMWLERCHALMNEQVQSLVADVAVGEFINLSMKALPRCINRIIELENFMDEIARQKSLPNDMRMNVESLYTRAELILKPPTEESLIPPAPQP